MQRMLTFQITDRLREGGISGVSLDNIITGVKNFMPARKELTITRLVEALMEPSTAAAQALQDTDDYLLFDPRATRGRNAQSARSRTQYQESVVFVVGGGGYVEYSNLQEWASRSQREGGGGGKKITYGSTEILNPTAFVQALNDLGS